ncbi:MAG: DUF2752 domain-containing protein [Bacteroidales bacterium]
MTLLSRRNSSGRGIASRLRTDPYILTNTILAGVIILVLAYSALFSPVKDNYPVACVHEMITGQPCVSCGLSHSFSLLLRGRISEAYEWNPYGLRIFLFFGLQLVMRPAFSFFSIRYPGTRQQLIIYDIAGSSALFLISFWPFIAYIFSQFR